MQLRVEAGFTRQFQISIHQFGAKQSRPQKISASSHTRMYMDDQREIVFNIDTDGHQNTQCGLNKMPARNDPTKPVYECCKPKFRHNQQQVLYCGAQKLPTCDRNWAREIITAPVIIYITTTLGGPPHQTVPSQKNISKEQARNTKATHMRQLFMQKAPQTASCTQTKSPLAYLFKRHENVLASELKFDSIPLLLLQKG